VHALRPVQVLLFSSDGRFGPVTGFLLARSGFVVNLVRHEDDLVEAISEHSPNVVVLDCADSLVAGARQAAALEALYPDIGVVVVGQADATPSALHLVLKWCPFEHLLAAIWRAAAASRRPEPVPAFADSR
jgi:DNA-binding NtrC family response regulator